MALRNNKSLHDVPFQYLLQHHSAVDECASLCLFLRSRVSASGASHRLLLQCAGSRDSSQGACACAGLSIQGQGNQLCGTNVLITVSSGSRSFLTRNLHIVSFPFLDLSNHAPYTWCMHPESDALSRTGKPQNEMVRCVLSFSALSADKAADPRFV